VDQLLTTQFWHDQWTFVMSAPWIILPLLLIAGFVGWRWKASNDDGEIRVSRAERDAAKGQLLLAHDKQEIFEQEINRLSALLSEQRKVISELRPVGAARYQFEALNANSASVASTVASLSSANAELGATLTLTGSGYRLTVEPMPEISRP
jgi:hypothetical protein